MPSISSFVKRFFIIIILCPLWCVGTTSHASNHATIDSLYDIYSNSASDTNDAELLMELATEMEIAGIEDYKNNTLDEYLKIAKSKLTDSLSISTFAFKLDSVGVKFRNNGSYVSALKFHNCAKDILFNINSKNQQSIIYNNIGVVYRRLDDYQTALSYHIKALNLAEEVNNLKSQAVAINSMGNIQMMIGNLDESLEYFKQSLLIEQKQNSLLGIAINLNNIGNVYSLKNNFSKSLEYYFLSLDINKEINSKKGIAICFNDIGSIYKQLGEFKKALQYYLDALEINYDLEDKYGLANSYLQVGELYTDIEQNNTALEYLKPALNISLEIGSKAYIMDAYYALYKISRASKDYEQAFNYLQLSYEYHDSITNINVRKDIARLQIKYESERKQNQIELLEQNAEISELEIKRQKIINWLTFSAFIISLGAVISLIYYLINKNKTNKLLRERNKIIEKTKAELDSYSKQLLKAKQEADKNNKAKGEFLANMSHEIRTPLNSVIGFTELLSTSTTDAQQLNHLKIIKSSSRTLLTIINDILDLSKIQAGKFTIDYENTNVEQIINDVMQMFSHNSLEKDINLTTNIQYQLPQIVLLSELRLRQILFNLIGNAINYTNSGSISIDAYSKPGKSDEYINLFINVVDTGIGIPENELAIIFEPFNQSNTNKTNKGTGLGLTITKRLVEIMNGKISVTSIVDKGTTFTISFKDVKIVNKFFNDEKKILPVFKFNNSVKPLLFINESSDCGLINIADLKTFLNTKCSKLEDAKNEIIDRNLVIICGFSDIETKNALNVLYHTIVYHRVNFVIINDGNPENANKLNDVVWLNNLTPTNIFISTLNELFTKIAFNENSNIYFHDLVENMLKPGFKEKINDIYHLHFKIALKTKMLNNIITFIDALQNIADDYKSDGLLKYCAEFNNCIVNFEIEEIDKLLNLFNTNYQKNK